MPRDERGWRVAPAPDGRGMPDPPAAGYFTKRLAEDWLRSVLDEARRETQPGTVRSGATFADAAAEFLRYTEHDRGCKPSTLRDYRSNLGGAPPPRVRVCRARVDHAGRDRRLARLAYRLLLRRGGCGCAGGVGQRN